MSPDTGNSRPRRILLIEDDARLRTTLAELLRHAGFEVIEAEEGGQGIALFAEKAADLVITDLIMPGKEGMETILELRQAHPQIKILAMSGGGRLRAAEYLPIAAAAGADQTIEKPFSIDKLLLLVNDLLESDPD